MYVAGAVAAALLLGGGAYAATRGGDEPAAHQATSGATGSGTCPPTVALAVDPAWADPAREAGQAWGASIASGCNPIKVVSRASATVAEQGLGDTVGWIPEDPSWLDQSKDPELSRTQPQSVGETPLVLVSPNEAAEAFGAPMEGEALRRMLTLEETWADHGHPDWGWFKMVVADPKTSVTGNVAFRSLSALASNGAPPPSQAATATADQLLMPRAEQRIVARPELTEVVHQLAANKADANGRTPAGPRAGVTTESLALREAKDVRATYLDDHSGLSMAVVNPAKNATLADWTSWLESEPGQLALDGAGVRAGAATPDGAGLSNLGLAQKAPTVKPNEARDVEASRELLLQFSRRTSALLVLDTSGSMAQPLGAGGPRPIDAVTQLLLKTWEAWPPGTASGMITFHSSPDAAERPVIQTVVPLQLDTTKAWAKARPGYKAALENAPTAGGTPLYEAIRTAWRYNTDNYMPEHTNRIVVVTDGRNEDTSSKLTIEQLLAELPKKPDPRRPIQVAYVALGPDADYATLKRIADATGQQALQINSVADLEAKLPIVMQP